MADLVGGGFFFACRSCEYSQVEGERKTKVIEVGNIDFYKGKRKLPHHSSLLPFADCVSITFVLQKNNMIYDTTTHYRSGDRKLCPVLRWANVVYRIRGYPNSSDATPVSMFWDPRTRKYSHITSKEVLTAVRTAAKLIGADKLGFQPDEIGTHSLRSGAAMSMYLRGTPPYTIMLLGRWKSDSWLRYIRKQVLEFSKGVSAAMVLEDDFFHVPTAVAEMSIDKSALPGCGFSIGHPAGAQHQFCLAF